MQWPPRTVAAEDVAVAGARAVAHIPASRSVQPPKGWFDLSDHIQLSVAAEDVAVTGARAVAFVTSLT